MGNLKKELVGNIVHGIHTGERLGSLRSRGVRVAGGGGRGSRPPGRHVSLMGASVNFFTLPLYTLVIQPFFFSLVYTVLYSLNAFFVFSLTCTVLLLYYHCFFRLFIVWCLWCVLLYYVGLCSPLFSGC